MKNGIVAATLVLFSAFGEAQITMRPEPMKNSTIEGMLHKGTPTSSILQAIRTAPEVDFLTDNYEFSQLVAAGASNSEANQIFDAMIERNRRRAPVAQQVSQTQNEPIAQPTARTSYAPPSLDQMPTDQRTVSAQSPMNLVKNGPEASRTVEQASSEPYIGQPLGVRSNASMIRGSRVFISVMEGDLDGFIAAEIIKQKLPLTVVTDEREADLILSGASIKEDDRWYHVAFGVAKDKNEGNVRLLDVRTRTMVWAGEAGDRSLWYGSLHRGGERKIADRIVHRMKKDLF